MLSLVEILLGQPGADQVPIRMRFPQSRNPEPARKSGVFRRARSAVASGE